VATRPAKGFSAHKTRKRYKVDCREPIEQEFLPTSTSESQDWPTIVNSLSDKRNSPARSATSGFVGLLAFYQLSYEGDEPPKLPNLVKRKASDEIAWGSSGTEAGFLSKLRRLSGKANEQDRQLILQMAQKMAVR
jgi:hypothetical protein